VDRRVVGERGSALLRVQSLRAWHSRRGFGTNGARLFKRALGLGLPFARWRWCMFGVEREKGIEPS